MDQLAQALQDRARQQEAVARLGQTALAGSPTDELFRIAVCSVGRILGVEYCEVLELLPENQLIIRATLPDSEGMIGSRHQTGTASLAGYALLRGEPVVMTDLEHETRFTPHPLMRAQGIVCGVNVIIQGRERPYGVINALSTRPRLFDDQDTNFLRAIANILGAAVDRIRTEDALQRSEQGAKRLAEEEAVIADIGRIISSSLDIGEVYERFAAAVKRVLPFDRISINIADHATGRLVIRYVAGDSVPGRDAGDDMPLAGTATEAVMHTGSSLLVQPESLEWLGRRYPGHEPSYRAGYRSTLFATLVADGRAFGALVLMSRDPGRYGPREIALAESVASQISGAIAHAHLFAEHQLALDSLRKNEASLMSIFRAAPVGIGLVRDRVLVQVNQRVCDLLGYAPDELIGRNARILYATDEDFDYVGREKHRLIRKHGTGSVETRWRCKDGRMIDVLLSSTPVDPSDESHGMTFTALDITARNVAEQERHVLEGRLRQAQKMEAIGTLAGGIAHDFNNILAAIIGFAELATIVSDGNAEARDHLAEVLKASFRARDLVRQILTFSRRTESELAPVDVHLVVKEALKLLRATLPSSIELRSALGKTGLVLGDPTQIHQIVMNLCTNAYQAMPREGALEVTLSEIHVDAAEASRLRPIEPGRCLKLSVRDTGHGIAPAIMDRIFDPYFTTKEKTKGTGLGLAVVHGAVKAHKGAIHVTSRLGEGTTFDVLLPLVDTAAQPRPEEGRSAPCGNECLLFVDDEPSIEALGRHMLEAFGYRVTTSRNPAEALARFRASPTDFDLVITDMTMPGMTGDRLAQELMRIRPELPVIVCTGYNELIDPQRAHELGIGALVMKPFLKDDLADLIRSLLDRNQPSSPVNLPG